MLNRRNKYTPSIKRIDHFFFIFTIYIVFIFFYRENVTRRKDELQKATILFTGKRQLYFQMVDCY
jgi:hypothetical protein